MTAAENNPSETGATSLDVETVAFQTNPLVLIAPTRWEAQAAQVRNELAEDEIDAARLAEVLRELQFLDDRGRSWCFDGSAWWGWDGRQWSTGTPPPALRLQRFELQLITTRSEVAPPRRAELQPPSSPAGGFWFYVDNPQWLESGGPTTQTIGRLLPGTWYRALRGEGAWVRAVGDNAIEGWVRADAVHPQLAGPPTAPDARSS